MYNKLFTKILDSSIWLESSPTRIVWLTLIAVMDETGFAKFSALGNLSSRARVTVAQAEKAVTILEAIDTESGDPENQGKRIERVPGGWMVLNAAKHRDLVNRAVVQEQTRLRVKRFRDKQNEKHKSPAPRNADRNASVTPSEAEAEAHALRTRARETKSSNDERRTSDVLAGKQGERVHGDTAARFLERYQELYAQYRLGARLHIKPSLDWTRVCDLLITWDAERLEKLAVILLTTDDEWVAKTDRGIGVFVAKASWCDDRLKAWEASHDVTA